MAKYNLKHDDNFIMVSSKAFMYFVGKQQKKLNKILKKKYNNILNL